MDNLFLTLFLVSLVGLIVGLIKPSSFSRFLKEKATRKNSAIIFGSATLIFFVLFGVTTETSPTNNSQNVVQNQQNQVAETKTTQAAPVDYEIVESEDISIKALGNKSLSEYTAQEISNLPTNKRMAYRIVVSPEIKEEQVRPTIQKIISDITAKDDDIDEISLLLYSDKELASGAYDVAMATWAPSGKLGNVTPEIAQSNNRTTYETTIQIKENLEEYLQKRGESEDKFGFSEEERREIFKEIIFAERRATKEADKIYVVDISDPNYKQENIMKNIDKNRELMDKYKAEVRNKYGITEDTEWEIVTEAIEESWPME
jgi:hypothetical protein